MRQYPQENWVFLPNGPHRHGSPILILHIPSVGRAGSIQHQPPLAVQTKDIALATSGEAAWIYSDQKRAILRLSHHSQRFFSRLSRQAAIDVFRMSPSLTTSLKNGKFGILPLNLRRGEGQKGTLSTSIVYKWPHF